MQNLYEFNWDCERNMDIWGRFFATQEEVDALIGKKVDFGEILGKHFEIYGTIEKEKITLICDNQEFLSMAEKLGISLSTGHNPFWAYKCLDCGSELDVLTDICEVCNEHHEKVIGYPLKGCGV